MTAAELIALAQEAGVMLEINEQGGLRASGQAAQEYVARYREHLTREKTAILALLRGDDFVVERAVETATRSDDEIRREARMEFAQAFAAKLEMDSDPGVPEWLEWAFWCLFYDAMEGFIHWGLGEIWPQVQEAAQDRAQAAAMRERALEGWAGWHRERERHRHSARWEEIDEAWQVRRDQLALECETWAWRAYLLELARRNPEVAGEDTLDPWVDLRPWAVWLARNGRAKGLFWSDKEAA